MATAKTTVSKTDAAVTEAEIPDGANLLRPVATLRSYERSDIMASFLAALEKIGVGADAKPGTDVDVKVTPETMRAIGGMQRVLYDVAIDEDEFEKFDLADGGYTKTIALAQWYLGKLGE